MSTFSLKYIKLVWHTMTELHFCITTLFILTHLEFFVKRSKTNNKKWQSNCLSVGLVLDHNLITSSFLFVFDRENMIYIYILVSFKYIKSCKYSSIRVETLFSNLWWINLKVEPKTLHSSANGFWLFMSGKRTIYKISQMFSESYGQIMKFHYIYIMVILKFFFFN